jgi:hypothetical protein
MWALVSSVVRRVAEVDVDPGGDEEEADWIAGVAGGRA